MPNAKVLGTIYGDSRLERALHLLFADDRLSGEWFAPSARLLAFINTIPLWAPRQPHVEKPDPVALARRRRKTFRPIASGNGPLPVPPGTLNCGAVRLVTWLRSSGAAQSVFAGLFSPPVQQALVSKWVRGVTIPSKRMRGAVEMVTSGAVVWESTDRKVFP